MTPAIGPRLTTAAVVLALALIGSFPVSGPARAEPKPSPKVAAALPVDISGALPSATRGEVTHDFLGKGYDQRLVVEGTSINLYEPPAKGGQRLTSMSTDLAPPPFSANIAAPGGGDNQVDLFECDACEQVSNAYGINAIYLVVLDGWLYISGTKGDYITGAGNPDNYRNIVYKVPLDLSCAKEDCANRLGKVVDLPANWDDNDRIVATTSMAGGTAGGNPYLAFGMTDYGVLVYDADLEPISEYTGMAQGDQQTPVITVAWDPWGSGTVAIGTMQDGYIGYFFTVAADGSIPTGGYWNFRGWPDGRTVLLSATFGRRADGSLVAAYGTSGGVDPAFVAQLFLVDPTGTQPLASVPVPGTGVTTVESLPRIDGSTGGDDFAVYSNSGFGSLIRYNEANNALSLLPLQPAGVNPTAGSATQLATDAWRSWFPGYKTGQLVLTNAGSEPVDIELQARSDAQYGCWFGPTFPTSASFPTSGLTLAAGQSSPVYTMGGLTAGPQGLCGATDVSGAWRGYLVVTPVNRPADVRVVNVQVQRQGLTVDVSDQAGGATTVAATQSADNGAVGEWTFTVGMPATPTPQAAPPMVKAQQITTNVRSRVPVYRVDVGPVSWTVPGAASKAPQTQIQAVLPPLQVQGRVNGGSWVGLGSLLPIGPLTRSGTAVTTSSTSFWWENPAGSTQYQQLQVVAGSLASTPVTLGLLPAPTAPTTPIKGLQLTSTKTDSSTVNVVPSGLDQGQVLVQINDQNGNQLPANNSAYDTVYYRDPDNNLITNLWDATGEYLGAQPAAGAYPNVGATPRPRASSHPGSRPAGSFVAYDYVTTTQQSSTPIRGWVGLASPATTNSDSLQVNDQAVNIEYGGGSGSAGFSLEGCSDFKDSSGDTCVIAPATPTRPAPYQAGADGGPPALGVQLVNTGQNAAADLPLAWKGGQDRQLLANAGLNLVNQSALVKLTNTTSFRPSDSVDLTLVSHGRSVPVTVPVSN